MARYDICESSRTLYARLSSPQCKYLAVRRFREYDDLQHEGIEPHDLFSRELEAYNLLRGEEGIVQVLAAYADGDADDHIEHNILLECQEHTLADYFSVSPPILPASIRNFWRQLFSIAAAVSRLHQLELSSSFRRRLLERG